MTKGFAITVSDYRARKQHWNTQTRFLKAWLTSEPKLCSAPVGESRHGDKYFEWSCGSILGESWLSDEGLKWVRGHGPKARNALEASQRLVKA